MIKVLNGEVEFDCEDVQQVMIEASILIMASIREAKKRLPEGITSDMLLQDLFKSLRFAALTEEGMSEEEAFKILNPEIENESDDN